MSAWQECERCGKGSCGPWERVFVQQRGLQAGDLAAKVCQACYAEISQPGVRPIPPRRAIPDTIEEALELMTGIQPTTLDELGTEHGTLPSGDAADFREMMDQDAGTSLGDRLDEEIRKLEEED